MASLFYEEDRNTDFIMTCEKVRQEEGSHLSVAEIVAKAILKPAQSFYVHINVYRRIIRNNGEKLPSNSVSKKLYQEVLRLVKHIKNEYPNMSQTDIAKILSDKSAPRFYISQARAMNIYYDSMK